MPRLLGPLLLLLPERRLVNQEVGPLRRIHDRGTRSCVTGEDDEPPRAVGPHNAFGSNRPPVLQSNCFALTQFAPQRTLGDACGARLVHVEPAAPLMLAQRVANRSATVLGAEHMDLVR